MRDGWVDSLDSLQIGASWCGTHLVLCLSGELDLCSAPQLRQALDDAAQLMPSGVFLDLELVSFMDAAGIRAILTGDELFGPRLVLRRTPPYLVRLFTITGLDRRLTFAIDADSQ